MSDNIPEFEMVVEDIRFSQLMEPKPTKHPIGLFVDRSEKAKQLQRLFDPVLIWVSSIGSAIHGRRFSAVIVCKPNYNSESEWNRYNRWVDESLRCRLIADCQDKLFFV